MARKEARHYAYRLIVEHPEGVDWRNPPAAWRKWADSLVWHPDEAPHFMWPRNRVFLSAAAANKRADRLRSYGCTVTVERSEPIQWPSGEDG